MTIPNKSELQQIVYNHSPAIDFKKDFMNLYKKCTAKCTSDNPLGFRMNILEKM